MNSIDINIILFSTIYYLKSSKFKSVKVYWGREITDEIIKIKTCAKKHKAYNLKNK